jgi:two-component system sensor histidine kinase YesM
VANEALDLPVPVMCVQSLVENACKHGIQHLNGQGLIQVCARVEKDALVISVRDNGVGIHPRLLKDLQKRIAGPEDMQGSVGLQNIYRRLKLHYGESASLTLQNAAGRGTEVRMRIPLNVSEKGA